MEINSMNIFYLIGLAQTSNKIPFVWGRPPYQQGMVSFPDPDQIDIQFFFFYLIGLAETSIKIPFCRGQTPLSTGYGVISGPRPHRYSVGNWEGYQPWKLIQ